MALDNRNMMSGLEKVATILVAVGDEMAATVLSELEENDIHKISSYMTNMGTVSHDIVEAVIEEFIDIIDSGQGGAVMGGKDYLKKVLEASLPPEAALRMLDRVSDGGDDTLGGGLEAVRNLEAKTISSFLKNEHPQTCAIILAHLDPQHAAEVIKDLPEKFQAEVTYRVGTLERISPQIIKDLDEALAYEFRSAGAMEGSQIGGLEAVAEIVNNMDRATEGVVLNEIDSLNPELAENIRKLMFVFEDLIKVDDRGMQTILKEVDSNDLLLALKTASDPLREKIFANMSERAALMMKEDLEAMGPVKISDVEKSQQTVLRVVKQLEDEGKIVLAGGGEELV